MLATKIEKTCPKMSMTATVLTDRQICHVTKDNIYLTPLHSQRKINSASTGEHTKDDNRFFNWINANSNLSLEYCYTLGRINKLRSINRKNFIARNTSAQTGSILALRKTTN